MYLGIDLGTSSIKIIICDHKSAIHAQASGNLSIARPKPLWSEQDPKEWWQVTQTLLKELQQQYPKLMAQVKSIGLSGQQHGAVLINAKGDVLRPAILWNDGRSQAECEELMRAVPEYAKITGNNIMPGFTAPKLLWVKKNEPEIFAQVDKVLLPKDYLRYCLTGTFASDMSDASGTSWLNVGARKWSEEMLAATDLNLQHMPELFEGSEATGNLKTDVANAFGFAENVVVAGGAGDNAAAAISINVISPGKAFLSLGTSGTYFVSDKAFHPNAAGGVHTFCHCLPNLWHQMNCHLSAASAIDWWANVSYGGDVTALFNDAEQNAQADNEVIFLPYLSGERSPHGNPYAQGVFFGMTHDTTRADLSLAVLQGVAFNFAEGQEQMLTTGTHIEDVFVVGGGARSLYWGKILATALQQSLIYSADREVGGALGAARLGMLAVEKLNPEEAFTSPKVETIIEPQQADNDYYAEKFNRFKSLYQHIKPLFTKE